MDACDRAVSLRYFLRAFVFLVLSLHAHTHPHAPRAHRERYSDPKFKFEIQIFPVPGGKRGIDFFF
jgi:hypothetical protein